MSFVQITKDIFASEERPQPKLACIKNWRRFAHHAGTELWFKMCMYGKVKVIFEDH